MKKILFLTLLFILVAAQVYAKDIFLEALNKQASGLYIEGQYPEAAKVAEVALKIAEESFSPDSPQVAQNLNNLAAVYDCLGRYTEAELLYKRALAIWEKALGPDHPNVATARRNLANLYKKLEKVTQDSSLQDKGDTR